MRDVKLTGVRARFQRQGSGQTITFRFAVPVVSSPPFSIDLPRPDAMWEIERRGYRVLPVCMAAAETVLLSTAFLVIEMLRFLHDE
jgi:hypothetical protein